MLHDDLTVSAPKAATEQRGDALIGRLWSRHEVHRLASLDPPSNRYGSNLQRTPHVRYRPRDGSALLVFTRT
jgi:hypothetical protein